MALTPQALEPKNLHAAPQEFTFAGQSYTGVLLGFNDYQPRRSADHVFIKRDGATVEDMGRAQYRLEVNLVFTDNPGTGKTCAQQYQAFKTAVSTNPFGLLTHPVAGQWNAFCEGPTGAVQFGAASNQILIRCVFKEASITSSATPDIPDTASAAQGLSLQSLQMALDVTNYLGGTFAKARELEGPVLDAVDALLTLAQTAATPLAFFQEQVNLINGIRAEFVNDIANIALATETLQNSVAGLIANASDNFDGSSAAPVNSKAIAESQQSVLDDAQAFIELLIETSGSPAGAADAIASAEITAALAITLTMALQQERPAVINYVVQRMIDVVTLAQELYGTDAPTRALELMALNHIPNPAAIPAGMRLLRYAR